MHDTLICDKGKEFKMRNLRYNDNVVFKHDKFWKLGWETFSKSKNREKRRKELVDKAH